MHRPSGALFGYDHDPDTNTEAPRPAPGRRTLTMSIPRPVQRREDPTGAAAPARAPLSGGGGEPLGADTRARMEPLFEMDLSSVRIHQGADAINWGAMACCSGDDLYFAPGTYSPGTAAGDELLAHELTHVAQQRAGRVSVPQGKGDPINADASLEAEADAVAARVVRGESAGLGGASARASASGPVQRRVYMALSEPQQMQVDAVADGVYHQKTGIFEQRLGQAAAADPRGDAAGTHMLQRLALDFPAQAGPINAQLGAPAATKAAFIAGVVNGAAPSARVDASRSQQVAQTFDLPAHAYPTATHVIDADTGVQIGPKVQVNQVNTPSVVGGALQQDSAYAADARARDLRVKAAGSTGANVLFRVAQHAATSLDNTKVLAIGWLVPGTHTFHEVMLAAQDAGLAYNPGPKGAGYANIAPITQAQVGLHLPSFFYQPDFLIVLARLLFPDDANDRNTAAQLVPADLHAYLTDIVNRFRPVHSDAELAPILGAGVARSLVEELPNPAFNTLSVFIAFNTIGGLLTWPAVQAHLAYTTVAAVNASTAQLVFGHLFQAAHPGAAQAQQLSRAQSILVDNAVPVSPGGNIGFGPARHAQAAQSSATTVATYGQHDRGVDLQQTQQGIQNANLTQNESTSIHEYTSDNFGLWHSLLGGGGQTPTAALGGLADDNARDNATQQLVAANGGLAKLPIWQGAAYRGTGGAAAGTQANLQGLLAQFSPGRMYTPHTFLSASKTVGDSFIRAADVAMVIDNVQSGHDIHLLSQIDHEREVLFEPHARFVVTRVENNLTPTNPLPANGAHQFTGGNLWVYMKEVTSAKAAPERGARDAAFNTAAQHALDGRRLVDDGMYGAAYQSYMTEQRPLARPEDRFEHNGAPAANQVIGHDIFNDWKNADNHMQARVGAPLALGDIITMHTLAAQHLVGAHPGQLRQLSPAHDVYATDGIGPNGMWLAVNDNDLAALQANAALTLTHLDAQPVPPNFVARGKNHTVVCQYVAGAAVAGAIAAWHGWYAAQFGLGLAMAPGAARNQAATQFAAIAQRRFISLHPFRDGNGRTSRLIMDHILMSFGLSVAVVTDPNQDTYLTEPQWAGEVATGLNRTANIGHYYRG